MSGPFTTITVKQYHAMQDVIGAALLIRCRCDAAATGRCGCGAAELTCALDRWRKSDHELA